MSSLADHCASSARAMPPFALALTSGRTRSGLEREFERRSLAHGVEDSRMEHFQPPIDAALCTAKHNLEHFDSPIVVVATSPKIDKLRGLPGLHVE